MLLYIAISKTSSNVHRVYWLATGGRNRHMTLWRDFQLQTPLALLNQSTCFPYERLPPKNPVIRWRFLAHIVTSSFVWLFSTRTSMIKQSQWVIWHNYIEAKPPMQKWMNFRHENAANVFRTILLFHYRICCRLFACREENRMFDILGTFDSNESISSS